MVASYMMPTPVWKSSYRLIFGEGAQPMLEGWAIVDNTTGEDWNKVDLSLVSGRPISFISQLYEPRYVARQTAELPEDCASAPVVYEGAVETESERPGWTSMPSPASGRPGTAAAADGDAGHGHRRARARSSSSRVCRRRRHVSTIAAPAAGRELGELFEYHIPTPVTVRRNESAMLPFLQQKIDARKLLIYSDPSAAHPLDAAEIVQLHRQDARRRPDHGLRERRYAGEALMETVKTGDKRLISYGVDLGTRITTQWDSKAEQVREIHARRGILTTRNAVVETRTYTIHNVDQKAKTLVIEHAARPEYNLLDRKPSEKTSNAYRFEVKLAPGATEKFPVTEERVYERAFTITDLTPDVLFTYVRNKTFSDAARKQLEQIADSEAAGCGRGPRDTEPRKPDQRRGPRPGARAPEHRQPQPGQRPAAAGAGLCAAAGQPGIAARLPARPPRGTRQEARRAGVGSHKLDRKHGILIWESGT